MVSCTHRVSLLSDSEMLALNWVKSHVPRFTPGVYRAYINLEYAAIDVGGYSPTQLCIVGKEVQEGVSRHNKKQYRLDNRTLWDTRRNWFP